MSSGVDLTASTQTKSGGLTLGGSLTVGTQLTIPSNLQIGNSGTSLSFFTFSGTNSSMSVANDNTGNGVGFPLVITAGSSNGGSMRPLGDLILKTGSKGDGSGSASGGASINFMTTRAGTFAGVWSQELRAKFTKNKGYFLAWGGGSMAPTESQARGIISISSPSTPTGNDPMLSISTNGIPVFDVGATSSTWGPGTQKVTLPNGQFGVGTSTPSSGFELFGGSITIQGPGAGLSLRDGPTLGGALCLNATGALSKCTSLVDASGNCTCP